MSYCLSHTCIDYYARKQSSSGNFEFSYDKETNMIVIFSGSFSTFTNNHMINVFTLVRASQNESPNSRYPRNPDYS